MGQQQRILGTLMGVGCRNKKLAPVLVGTTNQVEKEQELRKEQAEARAAKATAAAKVAEAAAKRRAAAAAKKAAAEAMEDDEAEAMEEEATSSGSGVGSSAVGGSGTGQKRTAPPAADLSATSGAAKRRAKKAESAAAVAPPSLKALILLALPSFHKGRAFYRSMLRAKVTQIDPAKTLKRKFGDKDEWRIVLRQLQTEGMLSLTEERDEIVVPLPTPSAPTADSPNPL